MSREHVNKKFYFSAYDFNCVAYSFCLFVSFVVVLFFSSEIMAARNKEVMEDFIEIYRSEPCIWNVKSADYSHRPRKEAAYAKLLQKLTEIEPCATRDAVLKKINSLRSNFRKELKKVKASKKSGSAVDATYKPTLWYFDLLIFLEDQSTSRPSVDTLGSDDDQNNREEEVDREEEVRETIFNTVYSVYSIANRSW